MNELWIGYLIFVFGVIFISLLAFLGRNHTQKGNINVNKTKETLVKINKIIYKVTSKYVDKKPIEKAVEQIIKREILK